MRKLSEPQKYGSFLLQFSIHEGVGLVTYSDGLVVFSADSFAAARAHIDALSAEGARRVRAASYNRSRRVRR